MFFGLNNLIEKQLNETFNVFFGTLITGKLLKDFRDHRNYEFIEFNGSCRLFVMKWLPESKYFEDVEWCRRYGSNITFKFSEWFYFSEKAMNLIKKMSNIDLPVLNFTIRENYPCSCYRNYQIKWEEEIMKSNNAFSGLNQWFYTLKFR